MRENLNYSGSTCISPGSIPDRARFFFHNYCDQTGCSVCPTFYSMDTGVLSPGVKRTVHEADHLPATTARLMFQLCTLCINYK